jgi:hypothetical protein
LIVVVVVGWSNLGIVTETGAVESTAISNCGQSPEEVSGCLDVFECIEVTNSLIWSSITSLWTPELALAGSFFILR